MGDTLPFKNCYIHTQFEQTVGICRIRATEKSTEVYAAFDDSDDYEAFHDIKDGDIMRAPENPPNPEDVNCLQSTEDAESASLLSDVSSIRSSHPDAEFGRHPIEEFHTGKFYPLVTMTYDLESINNPASPVNFGEEYKALNRWAWFTC